MSRKLSLILSVPPVAAALALSACTAQQPAGSGSPSSPPDSVAPSASPSATTVPAPDPTIADPADPDAPSGQCADGALAVAVAADPGGAGAGSLGYTVSFTNTGTAACELRGYPGVSVVGDGDGTQLGAPAERPASGPLVETVGVAPGASVTAALRVVNIEGGGALGCPTVTGEGWRVYPPHSFRAVFVEAPGVLACSDGTPWMTLSGPVEN